MARPSAAPQDIPDDAWEVQQKVVYLLKRGGADPCWQKWMDWYEGERNDANRPDCAPDKIYEEWWEAQQRYLSLKG